MRAYNLRNDRNENIISITIKDIITSKHKNLIYGYYFNGSIYTSTEIVNDFKPIESKQIRTKKIIIPEFVYSKVNRDSFLSIVNRMLNFRFFIINYNLDIETKLKYVFRYPCIQIPDGTLINSKGEFLPLSDYLSGSTMNSFINPMKKQDLILRLK